MSNQVPSEVDQSYFESEWPYVEADIRKEQVMERLAKEPISADFDIDKFLDEVREEEDISF